jgi:endonuclease/exonuclease/phosphatase family metal-dependent hydrolase
LRLEALEDRLALSSTSPLPHAPPDGHGDLTVMTYNLNNGSDLIPLLTAQTPQAIPGAVSAVLAEVTASDIPDRAVALAKVIATAHPDLVGVQEATVWSVNGVTRYDVLGSLVNALARQGQYYAVAAKVNAFGGALPDAQGEIVGLQDQNAILVRTDLPLRQFHVSNPQSGFFLAHFDLPLPGLPQPVPALDSWVSVDVTMHGNRFRFMDTHLDSISPAVNAAQAQELVALVQHSARPVILVGDFNASAEGAASPTYSELVHGGLYDAWTARHVDAGLTWGPTAPDAPKLDLSQRIDLILFHGEFKVDRSRLVGNHLRDRTPLGLWPSDHLGVVATLDLP